MCAVWCDWNLSRLRPGGAFGVAKSVEHTTVEAAQDVAHQGKCSFIEKICAVNRRAINFPREKARTIDVPNIVRWRGRICQGRSSRKASAPQASHAEMF